MDSQFNLINNGFNEFDEDDDIFNYVKREDPLEEVTKIVPVPIPILKPKADLKFIDLGGKTLPVRTIEMNEDSQIEELILSVPVEDKDIYHKGEFLMIKELLEVPGIGRLSPGTIVRYENNNYVLLFGWHTNPSNQTIYSWYLTRNKVCHTLYREMIDKINLVRVK